MLAALQVQSKCPGTLHRASNRLVQKNCKRDTQPYGTQTLVVISRADHPHLIAERYWGLNSAGGCAGRGHLTGRVSHLVSLAPTDI